MAVNVREIGMRTLLANDVAPWTAELARKVRKRAEAIAPVDSGRLKRSINVSKLRFRGDTVSVRVSTDTGYGLYPEVGTGIYGPKGQLIRPRRAPFLVFQPRGLGHVIRVRSVRGQPGQHYMRDSLLATMRRL